MREALRLARRYHFPPFPNPWVGCVVVKGGRAVGRGAHRAAGEPHAEIEALREAGARARGATLYVTLEPCCHFGRTPPCTEAIVRAGIRRVVYGLRDPNPEVAGQGGCALRANGLEVAENVCIKECAALNEVYLKARRTGLPFVTAKVATSLDGKIATRTGDSKWVTDAAARRAARWLRAQHQAVLVGIRTVLADDPHLGPRLRGAPEPWRVVLDSKLRTPASSRVVRSGRCVIATTNSASREREKLLARCGAEIWRFNGRSVPLRPLLKRLASEGILSLMVEGGAEVLGSFFDAGLVDRVCWFVSPVIIGSHRSRAAVAGRGAARLAGAWRLRNVAVERTAGSLLIQGNLSRWALAAPAARIQGRPRRLSSHRRVSASGNPPEISRHL
jgi:diaminohydroxyphosphoribosylaminopyrimidine deaminase/5-amino-6-(5-phosphoribosylamino)uracil reductase